MSSLAPRVQTPSSLPTTLLSLPDDILIDIINLTDVPTALSIARVSRRMPACAEPMIWRDVDLSLNARASTRSRMYDILDRKGHVAAQVTDAVLLAEIKGRVKMVSRRSEGGKLGLVRSLRIVSTGAAEEMAELLAEANKLTSLVVRPPLLSQYSPMNHLYSTACLQHHLFRLQLSFPTLISIRITNLATRLWDIIPLLINAAPNLTDLCIDIRHEGLAGLTTRPPNLYISPTMGRTRVQQLRLVCDEYEVDLVTTQRFVDVITQSPELRQLSVRYSWNRDPPPIAMLAYQSITSAAAKCSTLVDLVWGSDGRALLRAFLESAESGAVTEFSGLRRLVFNEVGWYTIFTHIPALPKLEVLYLNSMHMHYPEHLHGDKLDWEDDEDPTGEDRWTAGTPGGATSDTRWTIQGMLPQLADGIRGSPLLHSIFITPDDRDGDHFDYFSRLDEYERTGQHIHGHIRSIRHGSAELLIACLLLPCVEDYDNQSYGASPGPQHDLGGDEFQAMVYIARDGSTRVRKFTHLPRAVWRYYTDYDGHVVPLAVIRQMREVEGANVQDWDRRGVEVGEEAWQVLLDWKEAAGLA